MPKKPPKPIEEFRYSERGVIHTGDMFRARGGPTYKDSKVGSPGLYRMIGVETQGTRVYVLASPVSKYGLPCGGTRLLYVKGPAHRLKDLPDWIIRPYKIAKVREKKK